MEALSSRRAAAVLAMRSSCSIHLVFSVRVTFARQQAAHLVVNLALRPHPLVGFLRQPPGKRSDDAKQARSGRPAAKSGAPAASGCIWRAPPLRSPDWTRMSSGRTCASCPAAARSALWLAAVGTSPALTGEAWPRRAVTAMGKASHLISKCVRLVTILDAHDLGRTVHGLIS